MKNYKEWQQEINEELAAPVAGLRGTGQTIAPTVGGRQMWGAFKEMSPREAAFIRNYNFAIRTLMELGSERDKAFLTQMMRRQANYMNSAMQRLAKDERITQDTQKALRLRNAMAVLSQMAAEAPTEAPTATNGQDVGQAATGAGRGYMFPY